MFRRAGRRKGLVLTCLVFSGVVALGVMMSHFYQPEAGHAVMKDAKGSAAIEGCDIKSSNSTEADSGICETNISDAENIWWVMLNMLATLYVFLGLAIVCDDFFVSSLEVICDELQLTPDVAGATFMAAGSSAPELFTSVVGVFYQKNDVGIGTILGSAVFNILVIIGLSATLAGQNLDLDWKPFARDASYYLLSILLMLLMFSDHRIDWYEPVIFLVCYAVYIVVMKNNERLMKFLDRLGSPSVAVPVTVKDPEPQSENLAKQQEERRQEEGGSGSDAESDGGDILDFPPGAWDQFLWITSLPFLLMFKVTIPDCGKPHLRKYYKFSFFMSVAWIGLLCLFMTEYARSIGCMLNIQPAVMGLTLLAAGTSVPDALGSLFVAQDGEGDMAISNAIGSNVFDILLGLGLPWAVSMLMTFGEPIYVCSDGVVTASTILFVVLLLVMAILVLSNWKLNPWVGLAMFLIYIIFVVVSVANEYLHFM